MRETICSMGSVLLLILFQTTTAAQQDHYNAISNHLTQHTEELGLQPSDVAEFVITDNVASGHGDFRQVYLAQAANGLRVINGTATVVMGPNDEVMHVSSRFVSDLSSPANLSGSPSLSAEEAVSAAADALDIDHQALPQPLGQEGQHRYRFGKGEISLENIPVELVYWATPERELQQAWSLSIYQKDAEHWWHIILDAHSGEVIEKYDWVVQCQAAPAGQGHHPSHNHRHLPAAMEAAKAPGSNPDAYRVYEFPLESPSHGSRTLAIDPADEVASPFGWHDTNGVAGAEYTITRGNNAYAFEDGNDNNLPGFSPDGGSSLVFDFPLDFNEPPNTYQDAAITNAFYAVNRIHDILYHYGFDEAGGNFQNNNYGNGGLESDELIVHAQDGGGMNNANFATPPDGNNPRMQMYLWGDEPEVELTVHTPAGVAGPYFAEPAGFGAPIPSSPLTRDLALVDDGSGPDPHDACESIVNGTEVNGKIALIYRGDCLFVEKVLEAQDAGADAVVMINNEPGPPITMGGSDPAIIIPSVMISQTNGDDLVDAINGGATVNATLANPSASDLRDSDFDNGIIIHEYAHGITNRMTGGPSNGSCLSNAEQMGEGWSDWYACMLTLDFSQDKPANRPIGSYVLENPVSGPGIRNEDYDTSFAVNAYTYGDVNNTSLLSEPHGVGFVWGTMLWDLTWAFMKEYGMDDNLMNGTGGDNKVLQLVTDALKLQPCSPGFVDGRDAILLADQLNNNGANECLIWRVFAKRGLGYSAEQGSVTSRTDQVEAFDMPQSCQQVVAPPKADFEADTTETCSGRVYFTDLSQDIPQQWHWDFGDGNTDSVQNPMHIYATPGIYTVQLVVTNTLGSDTLTKTNYIDYNPPEPPEVSDQIVCASDSVILAAEATGIIRWLDDNFDTIETGPTFQPDTLAGATTFYVYNEFDKPSQNVGPEDNGIGMGAYHNSNFTGTVDFTTKVPLTIRSAHVNVGDPGVKEIFLWNAHSAGGTPVQSITHDIPFIGPQRIELNFEIEEPGEYSIGLNNAGLYRNSSGANYPYTLPGIISIVGSSAGQEYYYYLYDLEIDPFSCFSDTVPVVAQSIDAVDFTYADSGLTVDFTDQSGAVGGWHWDFGDGNISTEKNPTHTYADEGTYTVALTVDSCMQSHQVTIQSLGIGPGPHGHLNMQLHPNPGNAYTKLTTDNAPGEDLHLRLISIDGRKVQDIVLPAGQKELTIPLDDVAPSVYWLVPENSHAGEVLKLVVIK